MGYRIKSGHPLCGVEWDVYLGYEEWGGIRKKGTEAQRDKDLRVGRLAKMEA